MEEDRDTGPETPAEEQVDRIVEAAGKLGVEVDEADTAQWLTAVAASRSAPGHFAVDADTGIFGHRITLLDFDPRVLERYRGFADIVQLQDRDNVETAISLSGSAAQSRVQLFPGDADFFERVNIQAPTRDEACRILGDVMRDKALEALKGENYELVEVRWGTFLQDVVREGKSIAAGQSITWSTEEVAEGQIELQTEQGEPLTIDWSYGLRDPGWCKLDWVIIEPERGRVVHASNMLDVTWETPEGDIIPLDGFLDPYFQEVYLEAQSIPLFTKLVRHVSPDALQDYVQQLTDQVIKYSQHEPKNFGKAAKRMYNIFRLTGRFGEAAYIRELFDEPAALLYQVGALIDTIDEAMENEVDLDYEPLVDQVDSLILSVVRVVEGAVEEQIVDALLKLRDDLTGRRDLGEVRKMILTESQRLVSELVSEYFRERLVLLPEIRVYLDTLSH